MTAADDKGINLLPADLQEKREKVKRAIASTEVSYTEPKKGDKGGEKKRGGFFSFFKRKKKNLTITPHKKEHVQQHEQPQKDLPAGKPLPSALFSLSSKNKEKKKDVSTPTTVSPQKPVTPPAPQVKERATQPVVPTESKASTQSKPVAPVSSAPQTSEKKEQHTKPVSYTNNVPTSAPTMVSAQSVQRLHKPDFLHSPSFKNLEHEVEHFTQEKQSKKKKSFVSRIIHALFFKKEPIVDNIVDKKAVNAKKNAHDLHQDQIKNKKPAEKVVAPLVKKIEKKNTVQTVPTKDIHPKKKVIKKEEPKVKKQSFVARILNVFKKKSTTAPVEKKEAHKLLPKPAVKKPIASVLPVATQTAPSPKTPPTSKVPESPSQTENKPVAAQPTPQTPIAQGAQSKEVLPKPAQPVVKPDAPKTVPQPKKPSAPLKGTAKEISESKEGLTEAPVHRRTVYDVNLLAGEFTDSFKEQHPFQTFGLGVGLTVLIIVFAYAGLSLYQSQGAGRVVHVEQVNAALDQTIATYSTLEFEDQALRQKIGIIDTLLNRHISWNTFLGRLESVTIPEVTYTGFSASVDGTVLIGALATNYTSLARQMAVFQEETPWITQVVITSAALAQDNAGQSDGVQFDITLSVDPSALLATTTE